jgi:hypothetical protein
MAQKVVQYQAALQLAQTAPQLYDLPLLHRQMLDVLGIKNYQKLVPIHDDMKPRDPVTENQNMLNNKPVKAFLYQDHQAHIAVHMAMAQDPRIQQMLGQNPQLAQQLMAAGSAHVAEHLGMEMRKQMEQAMGQTLPPYNENPDEVEMSPEMEVRVSQMAAQAAQQLLQQSQQQAQQQKNKQMQEDPLIQLQQQEIQIKAAEQQRKAAKDQADVMLKQAQLQVERDRIDAQQETEGVKLAMKMQSEKQQQDKTQEQAGFSTGMDMQKHQMMLENQREIARLQAEVRANQQNRKKGD